MVELSNITGFDWNEGNRDKNWISHRVSTSECEEVFFNLPLLLRPDPVRSTTEARYFVLGQTNAGRHLFIAFTLRSDKIRVISARDMSKQERAAYGETNP
ncbi:MAG TPA: BrnT family toxin [Candidatus Binatia bacterium]|jgi:uncharacterized DUF497 family protein|nr:BrnT family toxin [Candidatus Binatia bacterium]